MADKLELQINRPEIIALKYSEGREYPTKIAGAPDQVMFTLVDGRIVFWPKPFAEQIRSAGISANVPFEICKAEIAKNKTQLQFRALGAGPAVPATSPVVTDKAPTSIQHTHPTAEPPAPVWHDSETVSELYRAPAAEAPRQVTTLTAKLCSTMCCLIDSMKESKAYAQRLGIDLTNEDLRCLANTAFIQASREGGR